MTSDALPTSKQIAIDIATPLGIKPEKLISVLKVEAGQTLEEGTIIAQKKSFLSLGKTEVKSPVAGEIVKLDEKNGTVIVALSPESETATETQIESPVEPQETEEPEPPKKKKTPKPTSKAIKKTKEVQTLSVDFGFGVGKGSGLVIKSKNGILNIKAEHKGYILLTSSVPTKKDMYKASAIGVEAIVVFGKDPQQAQAIKDELDGKAQIALLMVANDELNWEQLNGMELEVDGKALMLHIHPDHKED